MLSVVRDQEGKVPEICCICFNCDRLPCFWTINTIHTTYRSSYL